MDMPYYSKESFYFIFLIFHELELLFMNFSLNLSLNPLLKLH
jgi:hypothetical protein